jgi:hypothetical protein
MVVAPEFAFFTREQLERKEAYKTHQNRIDIFVFCTQIKKYVGLAEKIVICCCSEIAQFSAELPQNFVQYHHKIKYSSAKFSKYSVVKWHNIFCQILSNFCAKNPHIFSILWWYGTKFYGNLAENYAISEKLYTDNRILDWLLFVQ